MSVHRNRNVSIEPFISHYFSERPIDWDRRFGRTRPLDLEIGFGLGDFLVRTAQQQPERNFVGIEMDWIRVKKTLQKLEQVNTPDKSRNSINNVRVLQVEAELALRRLFAPSTIQNVYCLFPCPWPKTAHAKHRLFSRPFLRALNSRLVPDGEVKIVTDDDSYFEWILKETDQTGFDIQTKTVAPQFDTKYERKWRDGGQTEFFEIDLTKREHCDVPVEEDVEVQVYFADEFRPERFFVPPTVGDTTIVLKDFIYDSQKSKGMAHLVVAETDVTQHLWIMISRCERGWCISKAEGHAAIPTSGVAQAIRLIYDQVKQTGLESV